MTLLHKFLAWLAALFRPHGTSVPEPLASFSSERISVKTQGAGGDVILIPGLNSSPRVWAEMIAAVPGYRYHLLHFSAMTNHGAG